MKKIFSFLFFVLLIGGGIAAWLVLSSGTGFNEKSKFFIIEEGQTDKASVTEMLQKKEVIIDFFPVQLSLYEGDPGHQDKERLFRHLHLLLLLLICFLPLHFLLY